MSLIAGRRMKTSEGKILEVGDIVPGAEDWPPRILNEKIEAGIIKRAKSEKIEEVKETPPKTSKKKTKKKS